MSPQPSTPERPDAAPVTDLPDGMRASVPGPADVDDLHGLLRRHEEAARGWASAGRAGVETDVAGRGASTRTHLLVRDADGAAVGWAVAHDRAAGRVLLAVTVDPRLPGESADPLAAALFAWCESVARAMAAERGLAGTQLDSGAFADDPRQHGWLGRAGFERVRTWWQMSRPVTPDEVAAPEPRPGVVVRRVEQVEGQMPVERDLRAVHDVLEASFADHFNSHEESFDEFVGRLREDPGHRWDHWWLAELVDSGTPKPVGALVGSLSPGGPGESDGSYVEYLGVLGTARGRGVAKALLGAVVADAAARGRDRVGLEVDADSPTGADALYQSMGFRTSYVTQSWHRDLTI